MMSQTARSSGLQGFAVAIFSTAEAVLSVSHGAYCRDLTPCSAEGFLAVIGGFILCLQLLWFLKRVELVSLLSQLGGQHG